MSVAMSNEQFQEAIKAYLENNRISVTELARRISRSRETVRSWVKYGVKTDDVRQKTIEQYPTIFLSEATLPLRVAQPEIKRVPKQVDALHSLLVMMKIEQARLPIQNMTAILAWFLFEATAEERNQFRDSIGQDWKNFLELTRAMTGETAFEVTQQEGRLDWCKKTLE